MTFQQRERSSCDDRRLRTSEDIGNGVGVPQYLWKVVVDAETNNAIGFVFPNEPLPTSSLPSTITTIKRIEEMTGLNFHLNVEDDSFEAVEPDMQFWNKIN